jgi:predicted RNase H-like HicB family nuclease
MKVSVIIEKDNNGYYAFSPDLPGCQSQGTTFEETDINIREAITLYLETLSSDEISALSSAAIYTATYDIAYA